MKLFVPLIFILLLSPCLANNSEQQLFQQLTGNVISPSYVSLRESIDMFRLSITSCQNIRNIDPMKSSWIDVMDRWQQVQWVKFGPIKEESREWQLQFWPDTKNLIGRKVNLLLQKENLTNSEVNRSGLIVQGLPAIEYLLYDPKAAEIASAQQRCQLIKMIIENLSTMTLTLEKNWLTYRSNYYQENGSFGGDDTLRPFLILVVNSLVQQLDLIIDKKLANPHGFGGRDRVNPYFLESWRSQNSRRNIQSNMESIQSVFNHGGLNHYLSQKQHDTLVKDIHQQLKKILTIIQVEDTPSFFNRINEDKPFDDAKYLYTELVELRGFIKRDLVQALNIRLSFNASDGDS